MTASTHLAPPPEQQPEPMPVASLVITFLPFLILVVMFLAFMRVLRRSSARAEESVRLSREMVAELRAIRAALEHPSSERAQRAAEPSPPQRENTLSGQTLPSR
jgi:hypothetical protein